MLNNLRDSLKPALQKIGKSFAATGLSPNVFTGIGLALAFVASIIYGIGTEYSLILGGLALLSSGFFDIVDGQVARYANKMSKSGGFLDSVFDKIAEVEQMYITNWYNLEVDGHDVEGSEHNFIVDGHIVSGLGDNDVLNSVYNRQNLKLKTVS